jgi:tetratricopeptide (TPR) repeat protein
VLIFARRFDEAIHQLRKALELNAEFFLARCYLGQALLAKSLPSEALVEMEAAVNLSRRNTWMLTTYAFCLAAAGQTERSTKILEELKDTDTHPVVRLDLLAAIHGLPSGNLNRAFDSLNRAVEERNGLLIWLQSYFIFDGLRGDPRFQVVLDRIGLTSKPIRAA